MVTTRIKICCIANRQEAALAVRLGASALGFVSEMPSGPGVLSEAEIAEIMPHVPPALGTFLLTSRQDAASIIAQQRRCRTNTLQLCDELENAALDELRQTLPGIAVVQAIHVTGPAALAQARRAAPHVDALLLDSGNPSLAVKELGGTGRTHDWGLARRIRDEVDVPIFLAGGLRPENVTQAIRAVRPFAVDVCTGVRSGGALDEKKLRAFVAAVHGA